MTEDKTLSIVDHKEPPNEECIRFLKYLLGKAERGELTGIACIYISRSTPVSYPSIGQWHESYSTRDTETLIAYHEVMRNNLILELQEWIDANKREVDPADPESSDGEEPE